MLGGALLDRGVVRPETLFSRGDPIENGVRKTHAADSAGGYPRTAGAPRALKRNRDLWVNNGQLRCRHCDIQLGDSTLPQTLTTGENHLIEVHEFRADDR